jgi:hypothetical protein
MPVEPRADEPQYWLFEVEFRLASSVGSSAHSLTAGRRAERQRQDAARLQAARSTPPVRERSSAGSTGPASRITSTHGGGTSTIFISTTGIAGDPVIKTYAHGVAVAPAAQGTTCLLITREDLEALTDTASFVEFLTRRYLRAKAAGSVAAARPPRRRLPGS